MPQGYISTYLFWMTDCRQTQYYSLLLPHYLVLQIRMYSAKEEGVYSVKRQNVGDLEAGVIGKMVGNHRIRGLEEI